MADAAQLRDAASLPGLGTMMRSWCKKRTFGTKNDARQHDTRNRMWAENRIRGKTNDKKRDHPGDAQWVTAMGWGEV